MTGIQASEKSPDAELGDRQRWDTLDGTLATLRLCRSVGEFTDCAGELALIGCRAQAAAIGRVIGGAWTPWLRSGDVSLLEGDERVHDASSEGRQVVVAKVAFAGTVFGRLHVVGRDLDAEIVETYAAALGSMWALLGVRARAEEQRYALSRLRSALGESAERPIELVDTSLDLRGGRTAAVNPQMSSDAMRSRLTARQREVLDLMMAGLSNAEIAERLVVSLPTVKSHVRAVLRASGAVNRSDAVARFARG
ncbi:helix-turn-helix transcriptional regulator [Mycobacterium avium]|uniref:helix-turn-helix transcriptional regulator n=1 Tax=Mycobacterium avium TaxID=1764 RepID=UPI0011311FA3|nr:LuxR C-terminal-related transcriptional regulator [Mycobacterium avium]